MSFETERGRGIPTLSQVEAERNKLDRAARRHRGALSFFTAFLLVITSGALVVTLFLPVLEVSGNSMEPTLQDGDILVLRHPDHVEAGKLCGMYAANRLILKRVIALPGDVVSMDEEGNVFVNGALIQEPYVRKKSLGLCDLSFPITVPDNCLFVMGDHRETSIDSRSELIGCVQMDQVMGQVVARIWPIGQIEWLG